MRLKRLALNETIIISIKHYHSNDSMYKHHVLSHSPSHWQSAVQGKFAFTHLHLAVHPFLQEHWTSSVQDLATSGKVIHKGTHLSSTLFQPQRLRSCSIISPTKHWDQQWTAWWMARLRCWTNALKEAHQWRHRSAGGPLTDLCLGAPPGHP